MGNQTFARLLAAGALAALLGSGTSIAVEPKAGDGDPRLDMVRALEARDAHPSLGDQAKVFGRLVGTWGVAYTDFSKDGKITHRSGELIVGWVMDGRVIQDLWIVDPSGNRQEREVYTDLRYFDPKSRTWPAIFVDPEHASVAKFTGGAEEGDRIVLETRDFGDSQTRWSVNELHPDSFIWREEESSDGGKTWTLTAEHKMTRRTVAAP
jgi:hypothetical protein